MKRTSAIRRFRGTASILAALMAATLAGGPGAQAQIPSLPGTVELMNLEHVFTFNFEQHRPSGPNTSLGSDLEFYTATVPLRDYETGALVDRQGNPLADGDEPVLDERDFAIVGSYNRGGYVFDVTDPDDPEFVTLVECNQPRNDVGIKQLLDADGNERWVLTLTRQSGAPCSSTRPEGGGPLKGAGSGGLAVFDVTDPFEWTQLYRLRTGNGGAHNFAFHPTAPFGYVSNGALVTLTNVLPIVDFSDLDDPRIVRLVPTEGGVHDVEFLADGSRGYVASQHNHRIYDTTEPANPVLLSRTPNIGTYAHGTFPSPDRSLMVTNNESLALGGFFASGTGICPGEGLAAYDITGDLEQTPVGPLGTFEPPVVGRTPDHRACTSHFGRFASGTRIMSIGWYIGGARIIDWSNPSVPVEVASAVMPGAEVWAAKFHKGPYVYTGDLGRGFDVFRWSGDGPAPWVSEADLSITKADSPDPVTVGDSLTYTLEIANDGPETAIDVTVTDELPSTVSFQSASQGCTESGGTVACDLGDLDDGASVQVKITVIPEEPGDITNTATVSTASEDPDPSNNEASATTTAVCTITGTESADVLQGTPDRDVICGLGGDDTIRGLDGDDLLLGGDGDDRIFGNAGDDVLRGGPGDDDLRGGEGNDNLLAGSGDDQLNGGEGEDHLDGGPGADELNGGPGNDTCATDEDDPPAKECET